MSSRNHPTLERYREKNDAAAAQLFDPEVGLTSIPDEHRPRFEELLRRGTVIEDLASAKDQQIQAYGAERWEREFIRLHTIEGEKQRHALWTRTRKQYPRFARFQELSCAQGDFLIPAHRDDRGRIHFHGHLSATTLTLQPCLVDVDRIPDKFAEDMGFCDFAEDNGDPLGRMAKKKAIIPRLKLVCEATVPLQQGHNRIHIIQEPSRELQSRNPGVPGPDPATLGRLLYTRESANGEENQLMAQLFEPYGLHRKTLHQSLGYEREVVFLTNMDYEIELMLRRLDREWAPTKGTPERQELGDEAKRLLGGFAADLELCTNLPKVEAHNFLERCRELRDSRGKENVSAAMSQMVAAKNRLEQRFNEMFPKGGFNLQDRLALHRAISQHEKAMRTARTLLERGVPTFLEHSSHWTDGSAPGNAEQEAVRIESAMGLRSDPLRDIQLEPFRTYAECMRQQHSALRTALRRRDRNGSLDAIVHAHVIGKFQAIRTCFEHMKHFSIETQNDPLGRIARFATELREQFSTFQIVPEHRVPALVQPFEFMERALIALEESVGRFAGQHLDAEQRKELCAIIKEYLDAYDLEAMV